MTRRAKQDFADRRAVVVDILSQAVMTLVVERRTEREQRVPSRPAKPKEQASQLVHQRRDRSEHPAPRRKDR